MAKISRLLSVAARSLVGSITAVLRETDGTAMLEFGMASPLMIYTLFVAADVGHGLEISRRMTVTANTLAELSSQVSSATTTTVGNTTTVINSPVGSMTDPELTLIFNSIITTFPDVLADASAKQINWTSDIEPIVTDVVLGPSGTCAVTPDSANTTPATPVCTTATAIWSVGFNNAGFPATTRPCGLLAQAASNAGNPSLTTLPPGLYSPGSVIVVDLFYHYTPMFTKWVTGTMTFQRTAYMAPRFFYQLSYTSSGTYAHCP